MLVYFSRKVESWKISHFIGVVTLFCIVFPFGFWSGSPVDSVHSFEPGMCSVKQPIGRRSSWTSSPEFGCIEYVNCNKSLRNVDTSNLPEYFVELNYVIALDNLTWMASDWIDRLSAVIEFDQDYVVPLDGSTLDFEAEIMFINETSPEDIWEPLASTKKTRKFECTFQTVFKGYMYGCTIIPIFELSSVDYSNYLLNIRFRGGFSRNLSYISEMYRLSDIRLVLRHEDPGYSKVKDHLKSFFFSYSLFAHVMYVYSHHPIKTLIEGVLCIHSIVAVVVNVPSKFLWVQTRNPIWIHFTAIAEVTYQTSMFLVWIFSSRFLCYLRRPPLKFAYYRYYIFALLVWCSLTAYDEYFRWAVQEDPFFSPWDHYITAFKENIVYVLLRALVAVLAGSFMMYQFLIIFSNVFVKKNVLIFCFAPDRWVEVITFTTQMFAFFLLGSVGLALLQFNQNLLREFYWKSRHDDILMKYLLSPNTFTLFRGFANMQSIALLLLMPKLNVNAGKNDNKLSVRVFKYLEDFQDHVIHCCLHSQERLSFCKNLQQWDVAAIEFHGENCCLRPGLRVTSSEVQNKRIVDTVIIEILSLEKKQDKNMAGI